MRKRSGAGVRADGVVGQLGVETAPHEQLPGPVSRAIVRQRVEALREHLAGRRELVVAAAGREGRLDQLRGHTAPA